jgi:hypothetical protein
MDDTGKELFRDRRWHDVPAYEVTGHFEQTPEECEAARRKLDELIAHCAKQPIYPELHPNPKVATAEAAGVHNG